MVKNVLCKAGIREDAALVVLGWTAFLSERWRLLAIRQWRFVLWRSPGSCPKPSSFTLSTR